MSQPAPPPDESDYVAVLATAATTYALIAVEARIREEAEDAITDAITLIVALITVALASPAAIIAGIQLFANAYLYQGFTKALAAAREKTVASIHAGYAAAAYVAHTKATADLAKLGYMVPNVLPDLGDNIDRIIQDVDTRFGHTQTQLRNDIVSTYDNTSPGPIRTININNVLARHQNKLIGYVANTAATAVHQGASDALQAIYSEYQRQTGRPGLMKRWRTTAADPCGMCAALDGTMVGIAGEFDHDASDTHTDWRPVWRNLQGPPRHPNCRCHLELVAT